jgi:3-oxoacyl-[acyl-carrier protein] reductase
MVAGLQREYDMDLGLLGKKVLITGSSRGIGKSIAYGFLEEGADVVIVSRGSGKLDKLANELKERYGENRILSVVCDCSDSESLHSLNDFIASKWAVLDIVVANVGSGTSVPDVIPSDERWIKTWSSNFESALYTSRIFLPMLEKSNGNLLFISSITALEAFGAPVDYSTAKTAVTAFAKNIARKLAGNVRVNVVAPGNVIFPGSTWDKKNKADPNVIKEMIRETVPMNRFGRPNEIADAAIFLCSERSSFITGSVLVVDGGQTMRVL